MRTFTLHERLHPLHVLAYSSAQFYAAHTGMSRSRMIFLLRTMDRLFALIGSKNARRWVSDMTNRAGLALGLQVSARTYLSQHFRLNGFRAPNYLGPWASLPLIYTCSKSRIKNCIPCSFRRRFFIVFIGQNTVAFSLDRSGLLLPLLLTIRVTSRAHRDVNYIFSMGKRTRLRMAVGDYYTTRSRTPGRSYISFFCIVCGAKVRTIY